MAGMPIPEPLPVIIPASAADACREAAARLEVVKSIFAEHECHEAGWDRRDYRGFDLSIIAEQLIIVQHLLLRAAENEDAASQERE